MAETYTSRLTSKSQIGVPAAVRRRIGLEPGDTGVWLVRENEAVLMSPARYAELTAGLLKGAYGKTARAVRRYLREERRGWD